MIYLNIWPIRWKKYRNKCRFIKCKISLLCSVLNFSNKWREKEVDSWRNLLRNGVLLCPKSRNLLAEQRKVHSLLILPQHLYVLLFKTVFWAIFYWHNLVVPSAECQLRLAWKSDEGITKLCQLKIEQNTVLKTNALYLAKFE